MMRTRTTRVAWAAGFIDGEGYFTFIKPKRARGWNIYAPHIVATQIVQEPLHELVDLFGGRLYVHSRRPDKSVRAWKWQLMGARNCTPAIKELLPHLILKRQEAEVVAAMCDRIANAKQRGRHGLDDDELAAREELAARLTAVRNARRTTTTEVPDQGEAR